MPGEGRRQRAGSARCSSASSEEGHLRYAGRVGTGFTDARARPPRRAARAARARRRRRSTRRRRSRRGAPCSSSRATSPRSSSASGPRRACCAHPSYKGLRDEHRPPAAFLDAGRPVRGGTEVDRRGPRPARHQPRQGPLSRGRLHEARRHRLLRRTSRRCCCRTCAPAADAQALPQRRRRRALLREERAQAPAGLGRDRDRADEQQDDRLHVSRRTSRRSSGSATSPTSSCTRRCRKAPDVGRPDDARLRPRPGAAGHGRRVLPRRAVAAGDVRGPRAADAFAKTSGSKGMQVYVPLNNDRRHVRGHEAVREGGRRAARAARRASSSSRA